MPPSGGGVDGAIAAAAAVLGTVSIGEEEMNYSVQRAGHNLLTWWLSWMMLPGVPSGEKQRRRVGGISKSGGQKSQGNERGKKRNELNAMGLDPSVARWDHAEGQDGKVEGRRRAK